MGSIDVGELIGFNFYAGEERTLKLQLMESDTGFPHSIPSDATKTLLLHGTPLDLTIDDADIIIDPDDSSIFTVLLTEAQTSLMISGDIRFQYVTVGNVTRIASVQAAIKKLVTSFDD